MSVLDDKLESALRQRIQDQFSDKFSADTWKGTAFKRYTDNQDIAKIIVLEPTVSVATGFGLQLSNNQKANLQSLVTLDTTPAGILPSMSNAVSGASAIELG